MGEDLVKVAGATRGTLADTLLRVPQVLLDNKELLYIFAIAFLPATLLALVLGFGGPENKKEVSNMLITALVFGILLASYSTLQWVL